MIAKLKMIAASLGMQRDSGNSVSDDMLENGIWQFGDGMGITSILNVAGEDAEADKGEKVCTA